MSARTAFEFLLAMGCFLTGLGSIAWPVVLILATIYHARFVHGRHP